MASLFYLETTKQTRDEYELSVNSCLDSRNNSKSTVACLLLLPPSQSRLLFPPPPFFLVLLKTASLNLFEVPLEHFPISPFLTPLASKIPFASSLSVGFERGEFKKSGQTTFSLRYVSHCKKREDRIFKLDSSRSVSLLSPISNEVRAVTHWSLGLSKVSAPVNHLKHLTVFKQFPIPFPLYSLFWDCRLF